MFVISGLWKKIPLHACTTINATQNGWARNIVINGCRGGIELPPVSVWESLPTEGRVSQSRPSIGAPFWGKNRPQFRDQGVAKLKGVWKHCDKTQEGQRSKSGPLFSQASLCTAQPATVWCSERCQWKEAWFSQNGWPAKSRCVSDTVSHTFFSYALLSMLPPLRSWRYCAAWFKPLSATIVTIWAHAQVGLLFDFTFTLRIWVFTIQDALHFCSTYTSEANTFFNFFAPLYSYLTALVIWATLQILDYYCKTCINQKSCIHFGHWK